MEKTLMSRIKNFFNVLTYLLILIMTLYIGAALLFPQQFKDFNHHSIFVVVSDSMEPRISVMSLIIVDEVDPSTLELEDIISFNFDIDMDGHLDTITHRIAEINQENGVRSFRTKPENSTLWDNWEINQDYVIGRVVYTVPYIGHLVLFMNRYAKALLLILNILIWAMLIYLIKTWKKTN